MSSATETLAPLASVVICTWNRARLLPECLASLTAQEAPFPFEVVVVDDGSTDDTAAVVKAAADGSRAPVRYTPAQHGGVNAARNKGLAAARGRIVFFFDDDQLAPPTYVARTVARLESDSSLAGVGGPCRDLGAGLRTCPRCSLGAVDVPGEGVRAVPRLLGGNMAVRAEVFVEIGPFQEALSGRGDENEWFHRANGKRFLFDPDLWVWHRRDHFGLFALCRQAFKQGMTIPLSFAYQGTPYRPGRAWSRIPRGVAHAIVHRCAKGLWRASVEAGAVVGSIRIRLSPERSD